MKKLIVAVVAGFMSLAVAGAYAADDMKKGDKKGDGMSKSDKSMDKGMAKDDMGKDDKKGKAKKDEK